MNSTIMPAILEFYNLFGTPEHQETAAQLAKQLVEELGPLQQTSRPASKKMKL